MEEKKCILDPQRDCIGLAEAIILKKRIENLEEWRAKSSEFHENFYNYQRQQIARDARLDEKLGTMEVNLAKIIAWQEEQRLKPAKRWESVVDKILMLILGAAVALIFSKIGLQ